MGAVDTIIGALVLISVLAVLAERLHIAAPIAFLLGGVLVGFSNPAAGMLVPPEAILVLFLPILLMEAAYFTSIRDFRDNQRPIWQLALGLVVVTTAVVAVVFKQLVPDAPWALAVALGAIVAPPDAVAAISLVKKVRIPKRISVILEGESLVNDATGLVIYKFAVAAVLTGTFSATDAGLDLARMMVLGVGIGAACGYLVMKLFPYIKDRAVEILITFLTPYAAWVLAESVHGSGVLAVVAAGLVVSWFQPAVFTPSFRIASMSVWTMVTFVLNALVFLLIGLALPGIMGSLSGYTPLELAAISGAVFAATVFTRLIYVPILAYGWRLLRPSVRRRDPFPPYSNVFLVSWTGMRGVVTLATALALPLDFPYRELLQFIAFVVIAGSLLLQGLTFPWFARKLRLQYDSRFIQEDWYARQHATKAALARLEDILVRCEVDKSIVNRVRDHYFQRLSVLGDGPNTPLSPGEQNGGHLDHPLIHAERRVWNDIIAAERASVLSLRRQFKISDDVLHDLFRDLDMQLQRWSPANAH